ncbi:MAG TPA: alpha/beta hydrolase [Chitinophagaceae bacterium]|jgi:acetyl esterase/lipase
MGKVFLSTAMVMLFLSLRAQTKNPGEEIIYGRKDGVALTMLELKPDGKSNGKAIIRVMAGNWFSFFEWAESKDMIEVSKTLYTQRGYTVFEVVVASQPRYAIPDEINDLKRAIRYIRYNAKQLGIDPDHIGIEGGSAGGHLSLAVATADDKIDMASADPVDHVSSRVQAVAVLYPPTDFLNWGPLGNIINARGLQLQAGVYGAFDFRKFNDSTKTYDFISDTAARNKIGREISPLYFVSPDDPPVFIIHGDADPVVPLQQSQTIIAKFKEAGVPNNFIIKKGAKHNFDDMQPEVKQFADWFDKYLK